MKFAPSIFPGTSSNSAPVPNTLSRQNLRATAATPLLPPTSNSSASSTSTPSIAAFSSPPSTTWPSCPPPPPNLTSTPTTQSSPPPPPNSLPSRTDIPVCQPLPWWYGFQAMRFHYQVLRLRQLLSAMWIGERARFIPVSWIRPFSCLLPKFLHQPLDSVHMINVREHGYVPHIKTAHAAVLLASSSDYGIFFSEPYCPPHRPFAFDCWDRLQIHPIHLPLPCLLQNQNAAIRNCVIGSPFKPSVI